MLLQKIRDYVKGWFAYVIVGLLIIPFAVWGINYYFEGGGSTDVAVVDGSKITQQEYQRAYQQQRQRMQAMLGTMDPALLEGLNLKQQALQQLVNERVLNQAARHQGFRISDQQLHDAVISLPVFQQGNGFDPELYDRLLRNQGYTAAGFEESLRQSLAAEQLRNGVTASALVTPQALDQWVALLKQQRELHAVTLPLSRYLEQAVVSEEAVSEYFDKNRANLVNPEQVQLQWIELTQEKIAGDLAPSDEEIQASYQDQIAKYTRPEERSATHILVKLTPGATEDAMAQARTQAEQIAQAVQSGTKSFDQAVQEAQATPDGSLEAGDLGVITQQTFENPALAKALFALAAPGAISEPVQMPSGFHIVRLDRISPAAVRALAEVREAISAELRQQKAENAFYDKSQILTNLGYEHPDSLQRAAEALQVPIQESDWLTRQGGGEGVAAYPKVVESAFSEDVLKRGVNSEPLEVQPGHLVMIRVKEHQAATPRSLEQARPDIVNTLRQQQASQALAEAASQLKTRAAAGEHLVVLAQEMGGTLAQPGLVGRDAQGVDRAVLEEAFRLPQPTEGQMALGTAQLANGDQVVLTVTRVTPGAADALSADERKRLNQQLSQQAGSEQFESLLENLRTLSKIVLHSERL